MKNMYVVGISRDGRGAIVHWTQKVESKEQAEEIMVEWQAVGITNLQIVRV